MSISCQLIISDKVDKFLLLSGKTDDFHLKDNGCIRGDPWLACTGRSSLATKGKLSGHRDDPTIADAHHGQYLLHALDKATGSDASVIRLGSFKDVINFVSVLLDDGLETDASKLTHGGLGAGALTTSYCTPEGRVTVSSARAGMAWPVRTAPAVASAPALTKSNLDMPAIFISVDVRVNAAGRSKGSGETNCCEEGEDDAHDVLYFSF